MNHKNTPDLTPGIPTLAANFSYCVKLVNGNVFPFIDLHSAYNIIGYLYSLCLKKTACDR